MQHICVTKMRLTSLSIDKLSAPEKGQKTHFDDGLPGFGIRISQGGSKSFVVVYGRKRQLKTLGRYPKISLKDARAAARRFQSEAALLSNRNDIPVSIDFDEAKQLFLADANKRLKGSTSEAYDWLLNRHFRLEKKLAEIARADVMQIVDGLKATPSQQQHAFVAIRTLMNWCVKRGLIEHSPVPSMSFKTSSRSRILSDMELAELWQLTSELNSVFGDLVRLLILTGQRRGEISRLQSEWIKDNTITFPSTETKNRREHTIPVGSKSLEIIERNDAGFGFLFPSRDIADRPFNGWSKSKRNLDRILSFSDYTLHDLRRTFASNHARLGTPIHVTERLLNHVSGSFSGVAGIYNRYSYVDEMREACRSYEDWITATCSSR